MPPIPLPNRGRFVTRAGLGVGRLPSLRLGAGSLDGARGGLLGSSSILEPTDDPTGLRAVIFGALGLTGVIVLLAVLVGAAFAGVLFWLRSRRT